jgi:hypothetical protein
MKKLKTIILLAGCVAALGLGANSILAQGRGGDPAQRRQQMMDRYKEQFGITDDAEWKVIEPKITKVMDAEREVMTSRMGGMFGGRGGRGGRTGGGGTNSGGTNNAAGGDQGGGRPRGGGFFGEPSPESTALQSAVDAKAPTKEIKEKLAKLRAANKAKEEALDKAQDDLRGVLTSRQEAVAVLGGLLK